MKSITLRSASLEDISNLHDFEQGIIAYERTFDPTLKQDGVTYYDLKELIKATDAEIVVALDGNKIVGSGYAKTKLAKPHFTFTKYAYLGFMFVEPAYRGKGINRLIMDHLKQWSISQGLDEIRLEVYNDNHAAIKAYKKAGFTSHMLEMRVAVR